MVNYQNGKLYAIRSNKCDEIYVGSTTQPLSKRIVEHRSKFKKYNEGKYHYISSFEILKLGDAYIELLQDYPCERKEELQKKEGEIIRELNCVNKVVPKRTPKEYAQDKRETIKERKKEWYKKNFEEIQQKQKEHYLNNKEAINEYQKEWYLENKDRIKEKGKQYREDNKEILKEKQKKYNERTKQQKSQYDKERRNKLYNCECGKVIKLSDKSKHVKSKKHQTYIKNQQENPT